MQTPLTRAFISQLLKIAQHDFVYQHIGGGVHEFLVRNPHGHADISVGTFNSYGDACDMDDETGEWSVTVSYDLWDHDDHEVDEQLYYDTATVCETYATINVAIDKLYVDINDEVN